MHGKGITCSLKQSKESVEPGYKAPARGEA